MNSQNPPILFLFFFQCMPKHLMYAFPSAPVTYIDFNNNNNNKEERAPLPPSLHGGVSKLTLKSSTKRPIPMSSSHSLFHADIAPPRFITLTSTLLRKHVFCITNLSSLTDFPANLAAQLQLHSLASQERVVFARTVTLRHSSG